MTCVYRNGKWADVVEVDKFAELKEAYRNGAVIQFKNVCGNWHPATTPNWDTSLEYRIKPEEPIKVGDVCKFWDGNGSNYEVGSVIEIDTSSIPYRSNSGCWYRNANKLTKEEAIDLLFNKK